MLRRRIVGVVGAGLTVALLAFFAWAHIPLFLRLVIALPAMVSTVGFLQAARRTCVSHARGGTIEHEDFSITPAPPDELEASQRVASKILRDAAIVTAVVTVAAIGLALAGL